MPRLYICLCFPFLYLSGISHLLPNNFNLSYRYVNDIGFYPYLMRSPILLFMHHLPFALAFFFLLQTTLSIGQETASTSKATDKLYEKGFIKNADSVNTKYSEFLPSFYQNGIVYIFSSRQNGSVDQPAGTAFVELFYAELGPKGDPMPRQPFPIKVNHQVHKGQVTFNRDGSVIFFTQSAPVEGMNGDYRLKVYEAKRGAFDWMNVKELPFNSDDYSVGHPSISPDGNLLYFASDMPGGQGGFDLYMSERQANGSWTSPVNLGSKINTSGNEMYPFIHESGNLFFSSNGHPGKGGLDIFKVEVNGQNWGEVQNFGFANSKSDEFGFVLNEAGTLGFLASNHEEGKGSYDIYRFKVEEGKEFPWATKIIPTTFLVYDEATKQPLEGASIWLYECSADGHILESDALQAEVLPEGDKLRVAPLRKPNQSLGTPTSISSPSNSTVLNLLGEKNYMLLVSRDGYADGEILFSTTGKSASPQRLALGLKSAQAEELERDIATQNKSLLRKGAVIVLNDIQYDFNKSSVRKGETPELDALAALMSEHPGMQVELVAHTDSRGSEKYNLDLSNDRANAAKAYLVSRGISSSRVKAKGMGKAALRNACSDGVECSEEEHSYNRRIEAIVTKF